MDASFWQDLLVALIGAVAASLLAVLSGWGLYRREARQRESQAADALLHSAHTRRALYLTTPRVVPNADKQNDRDYAVRSVLSLRDEAKDTYRQARAKGPARGLITEFIGACNRFAESSEVSPDHYQYQLMSLRGELIAICSQLAILTSVDYLEPGEGSIRQPTSS